MSGKTAILGGGVSGLSAAYYLLENPRSRNITLIEASGRTGGWLRSKVSPNGVIFEEGPRTVRPRGPAGSNTLHLIDRLKLTERIIPISLSHPAAKNRMIYAENKLHKLPNSLLGMFRTNSPFDRPLIGCLLTDLRAPRLTKDDESIYSFVERRLGKDVADYLISPMICGICAGDARQISVKFLMTTLFEHEQKHGSIMKGFMASSLQSFLSSAQKKAKNSSTSSQELSNSKFSSHRLAEKEKWSMWTLRGGLEQLSMALADDIRTRGVDISLHTRCEGITFADGGVELDLNGERQKFAKVISSLSAKRLADLVQRQHPKLAAELLAIPYVNVAVVNLVFAGNVLEQEAFGFLVAPKERLPILGVIYDSCILPRNNTTVLTVMMGGAWFESHFGDHPTEAHLLSVAIQHTKRILNIEAGPLSHNVAILKDCIPQYVVGHHERIKRIEDYVVKHQLPLSLCGSAYKGVGLNDVILSGQQAASAFYQ